MLKISTKSRYGLRILIQIALADRHGHLANGRDIAAQQDITEPYLEQIMIRLKAAGLVKARRGCRGGYRLGCPPEKITVMGILELFEGNLALVNCDGPSKPCPRRRQCPVSPVWRRISGAIRREAADITVSSLLPPLDNDAAAGHVI